MPSVPEGRSRRRIFGLLVAVSVVLAMTTVFAFDRNSAGASLLRLSNLVGPTTASLLGGRGLAVCTEAMGTPGNPICFHGARMPVPTMVVAMGVHLLGDRFLPVAVLKTLLLLLPLQAAMYLVCLHLPRGRWRRGMVVLLLMVPFGMTAFLADVVNLQVEEGYTYSPLALLVAILFFGMRGAGRDAGGQDCAEVVWLGGAWMGVVFGLSAAALYLAKSSMAPAVLLLTAAFVLRARSGWARVVPVALLLLAGMGWGMHQRAASGRWSLGTSLDGINLHKGNEAEFLRWYPPPGGDTLDRHDAELNRGRVFGDEWSFNDFHERAAVDYMEGHVRETARGDGRKLEVLLLSLRKVGSGESHGGMLLVEDTGMLGFRMLLWGAIAGAVYGIARTGAGWRWEGGVFLLLVGACALPYVAGFAYTRHGSVLIYPAALMGCRMLVARGLAESR